MRTSLLRAPAAALLFPVLLLSGCVWTTRKLPVPKPPSIMQTVAPDQLVARLNQRWEALDSLNATVEVQASVLKSKEGVARDYTSFRGHILMRKPEMLRVLGRFRCSVRVCSTWSATERASRCGFRRRAWRLRV
jgi:hypothetical protein